MDTTNKNRDRDKDRVTSEDMDLALMDSESLCGALDRVDLKSVFLHFQNTPPCFVKQRPGRGGATVDYVEGWYIKQILNLATKYQWSTYIDGSKETNSEVIVWGRVTIVIDGREYTQSSFGQSEIHFFRCDKVKEVQRACQKDKSACLKHTCEVPVCIGDDYKAAQTDMIKKAASHWGIAKDVYGKRKETE